MLDRQYDTAGLRTLCFDLGFDYDNLAGEIKRTRFESLLRAAGAAGSGPKLLELAREEFPQLPWPVIEWDEIDWRGLNEEMGDPLVNMADSGAYIVGDVNVQGGRFAGRDMIEQQVIIQGTLIESLENLPPEPGEPPFKGLAYFSQKDARLFFGRDRVTAKLVNKLHDTNLHAVVGASGSGKSSIVRAGILPLLTGQRVLERVHPPAGLWEPRILTPTARPLDSLASCFFPPRFRARRPSGPTVKSQP